MNADSYGIAIAGNLLVDILNIMDKYPAPNMLSNINEIHTAVGGCVPNTIIDIAKIDPDIPLSAIGKVGDDEHGRFLISTLKKHGIDASGIKIDKATSTSFTYVMSEQETGGRTFFHFKGANKTFSIDDIDIDNLNCKMFHAGYILLLDELDEADDEYGTKMAHLLAMVSDKGIKTSIDVVSEDGDRFKEKIVPALKYCDYAIMNEIESCGVTGFSPRNSDGTVNINNIQKTMMYFLELGVREKVIIHCSEAGFIADKNGEFITVPSLELPKDYIKGSTGAGDAFAAASLYGIYKEWDNKKILEFASGAAACNLSATDSVSGMKPAAEIEKLLNTYPRRR